jgi:hypothetical protein
MITNIFLKNVSFEFLAAVSLRTLIIGHNAVMSQVNQIPVIQRNVPTDPWQWKKNVPLQCQDQNMLYIQCYIPVAYRGGWGFQTPHQNFDKAEPNSQFYGKYIRNNIIRIWVSLICKFSRTPYEGATAPDAHSLFSPLSPWIFCPPPSNKIPGYATAISQKNRAHRQTFHIILHGSNAPILSARSPWWLNFIRLHLIFVGSP